MKFTMEIHQSNKLSKILIQQTIVGVMKLKTIAGVMILRVIAGGMKLKSIVGAMTLPQQRMAIFRQRVISPQTVVGPNNRIDMNE